MKIAFDPNKNERNIRERQLPFDNAADFDWETAMVAIDDRFDYPEARYVAVGFVRERLHVLCFTLIADGIRVISFRKANSREVKRYEQKATDR
ncbi:BrnT family toxin [Pelagibacterium sediminicola]|uniref:BrnT family toxin n=1 Tax=Pelagibacterium sediminicola TaxID=2248761 RepID=UPI000E30E20D|nr:BrnT family toxin [Pelagibacterium sediminicola]